MAAQLALRTPPGAVSIPVGQTRNLGTVSVGNFEQIRVVAFPGRDSQSNVVIRLIITEDDEFVAQLDALDLTPGQQVTRVYAVLGRTLTAFAAATGTATGTSFVGLLLYGFAKGEG
jgi:hypothetical protein